MTYKKYEVWFWQRIVSPHMTGLADALAEQGWDVTYVAEEMMSEEREQQGWILPKLGNVRLVLTPSVRDVTNLVKTAPAESIHICQGVRSNGVVKIAQRELTKRKLRQWVVMETVKDAGWIGLVKRFVYRILFSRMRGKLNGVLAIGYQTKCWVVSRGVPSDIVFPFAYYLSNDIAYSDQVRNDRELFRFIFVGALDQNKYLSLLINALSSLNRDDVELAVVGSGPMENELRMAAEVDLPDRVTWYGTLPIKEVPREIASSDCLVLPSKHDGWGVVVSEALMVGTPVICSDHCGSAAVVKASGQGDVFRTNDKKDLIDKLQTILNRGRLSTEERRSLAEWGKCLGAIEGAKYLHDIFMYTYYGGSLPQAPWNVMRESHD